MLLDKQLTVTLWSFDNSFSCIPFNPFHATALFLYPLKTAENLRFCDVFKGYRKRRVAWNGLIMNVVMTTFTLLLCSFSSTFPLWWLTDKHVIPSWQRSLSYRKQTGFYMIGTFAMKELNIQVKWWISNWVLWFDNLFKSRENNLSSASIFHWII